MRFRSGPFPRRPPSMPVKVKLCRIVTARGLSSGHCRRLRPDSVARHAIRKVRSQLGPTHSSNRNELRLSEFRVDSRQPGHYTRFGVTSGRAVIHPSFVDRLKFRGQEVSWTHCGTGTFTEYIRGNSFVPSAPRTGSVQRLSERIIKSRLCLLPPEMPINAVRKQTRPFADIVFTLRQDWLGL
jgi:hypothetical protein